jgi:hypothetical protein
MIRSCPTDNCPALRSLFLYTCFSQHPFNEVFDRKIENSPLADSSHTRQVFDERLVFGDFKFSIDGVLSIMTITHVSNIV